MTFAEFIADKTATRVVLAEVVSTTQTHYFSNITYVTGPAETPANTVYKGRIADEVTITRMMSSVLGGNSAAANGGDLIIGNEDGDLDGITSELFLSVTMFYGDKDDARSDFTAVWSARITDVNADDEVIRFALADKYDALQQPAQKELNIAGDLLGTLRPLTYGFVRNIPLGHELVGIIDASSASYIVGESHDYESPAEQLFKNQAAFTPTTPTLIDWRIGFGLGEPTDTEGTITGDIKGVQDINDTWLQTPGEILKHILTRKADALTGIAQGGGSTTITFDDKASDQDDEYNGLKIDRYDVANDAHERATVDDYDGGTRVATVTASWANNPQFGDGYEISLGADESQPIGAPFSDSDLDTASFDQLDTDLPYRQNLFVNDGRSFVEVMNDVLGPGAYHFFSKSGLMTVGTLVDPSGEAADLELTRNQLHGRIRIVRRVKRPWRMRLGFRRNYTPSSDAGDATNFGRIRFITKEWRYKTKIRFASFNDDPTAQDITIHSTIDKAVDAGTELERLWDLFNVERTIYEVETFTESLAIDLGDIVKVTDDRLGLDSGKQFVLIGIRERLMSGTTQLVLWG